MMRQTILVGLIVICAALLGCTRKNTSAVGPTPTAFGTALVESSGGKQIGGVGTTLPQPVVVQVNDDQGNGVAGAPVEFTGPRGVSFDPASGVTDSSGQFTTNVMLGSMAGRYQLGASTHTKAQKSVDLKLEEIALGDQERLGAHLDETYCNRCHNPESTPERVSNYDNLEVKPHSLLRVSAGCQVWEGWRQADSRHHKVDIGASGGVGMPGLPILAPIR